MIHPTAIIEPGAKLADGVSVGAYSIVGKDATIGERSWIGPHVVIEGRVRIGRNNRIHPFSSIGGPPQDKKYAGEDTSVEIGDGNTIREYVTINRGTMGDAKVTRLGDDNWIMAYVHLAHDVQLGSQCILANNATLAGHVHVGDWVIVGGLTGVHQYVKIGAHAMLGFQSAISQDVPPFMMVDGNPSHAHGFNVEGLRRRGFGAERIAQVKQMHRLLYRKGLTLEESRAQIAALKGTVTGGDADVELMLGFLGASTRGIVR